MWRSQDEGSHTGHGDKPNPIAFEVHCPAVTVLYSYGIQGRSRALTRPRDFGAGHGALVAPDKAQKLSECGQGRAGRAPSGVWLIWVQKNIEKGTGLA